MRSSLSLVVLGLLVAAACSTNRQENPVSHADGATADTLPGRETASASIEASPDRPPDQPTCTDYYPSDPKSCQESTCVRMNCDPYQVSGDSGQTDSNGDGSVAFACGAPGADASTCTSGQFCVMSIAGIVGSVAQYRCATPSGDCVANPTCECLCPVPGNRSPGPGCIAVGAATNSCQCGIVRGVLTLMCGGI